MPFTLSKTRYCNAVQCPKMLWLRQNMPEAFDDSVMNEAVLNTGSEVGDLAMGLFGEYTEVPYGDLAEMIRVTQELMKQKTPVICEASFSYSGLFCSVDILKNKGNNKVELYEVKSSTSLHDIYIDDVSYQVYVLTKLGYEVTKACLVHLYRQYVRFGELDLQQLFTTEDLTDIAREHHPAVEATVSFLKKYMRRRKEPDDPVGGHCFAPYACGFFAHCTKDLPSPNVFDLKRTTLNSQLKMFDNGIISFADIEAYGKAGANPMMQVRHALHDLPDHIEKEPIRSFLKDITYPLYYLDFETIQPAVPLYNDSSPYDQIPFQYSLHFQKRKNGTLYHKEFLAMPDEDPRRNLAEQLCRDIPDDACVLAYNMAFEKTRLKELAALFGDLEDHLMAIHDNMRDLMIPFQKRWYYTRAMQGSYSIKYVLPALFPDDPALDYHSLDGVHNGQEASDTFMKMRTMDEASMNECRIHLLRYCALDTLAMVKVLARLNEAAK